MTDVSIFGQIRGSVRQLFTMAQAEVQPMLGDAGELLIAESIPPLAQIVKEGNSWQVILTTGLAATTALPTTTAGLSIFNGEQSTGKSYIVEGFGSYQGVVDATQSNSSILFAMMNKKTSAAPTGGTLLTNANIGSLSGKGAYGGNSVIRSGATVINDVWFPHGIAFKQTVATAADQIFEVTEATPVRGLYVIPPGATLSIAVVKSAAAAAAQQFYFARWHEVQLNLG